LLLKPLIGFAKLCFGKELMTKTKQNIVEYRLISRIPYS